jgi:hypothetical protein
VGLRNLPSKSWPVTSGQGIAANMAAGIAAWTRLLGHRDDEEPREADPDTLRYRIGHIPARLAVHARQQTLKISPRLAPAGGLPRLLAAALRPASTRPTRTNSTNSNKAGQPRRGRSRRVPGHPGHHHPTTTASQTGTTPEIGSSTISNQTSETLND